MTEHIRLKAVHAVKYNEMISRQPVSRLAQYANVDDITLKKAPAHTLEGQANKLLLDAERAEQAEGREQARRFDRSYVEKCDYSITSLYSDLKTEIEDGRATWDDYKAERKKWKRCSYKFCLNMYAINRDNFTGTKARRADSRYCSDECRKSQYTIETRLKETGSYMPVYANTERLDNSDNDKERTRVVAVDDEELMRKAHEAQGDHMKQVEEQVFDNYHREVLNTRQKIRTYTRGR